MKAVIIIIICALYCNVFSQLCIQPSTNAVSHGVAGQPLVSLCVVMCFGGGVALESDLQGGWDIMLSKLACYS